MTTTHGHKAWVRPEPRRCRCIARERAEVVLRRAHGILGRGLLLGMKLTRAALDAGISRLQKEFEAGRADHTSFRKISIK